MNTTKLAIRKAAEDAGYVMSTLDTVDSWHTVSGESVGYVRYDSRGGILVASFNGTADALFISQRDKDKIVTVLNWFARQISLREAAPVKPVVRYRNVESARANFDYMLRNAVNAKAAEVWFRKLAALDAA